MSLMWMPASTTVPPGATALRAGGTRDPRGANRIAALRHVARARCPDAVPERLRVGEGDRVGRPAELERADRLEALELQVDRAVDLEADERRPHGLTRQPLPCGPDLVERRARGRRRCRLPRAARARGRGGPRRRPRPRGPPDWWPV